MRSFLIALIIIVPILLTLTALRRSYVASRRYTRAEGELIDTLKKAENRSSLSNFEGVVTGFLAGQSDDPVQLAGAIKFITEEAERLDKKSPIVRILRHGSDYSKARYLDMLFSKIPPPPPDPPYRYDPPNQSPPSSTARRTAGTARRTAGQARDRDRATG